MAGVFESKVNWACQHVRETRSSPTPDKNESEIFDLSK